MTELTLTVQVHEDAEHLSRLLRSIGSSPVLRRCPLLVVNNSHDPGRREAVNRAVRRHDDLDLHVFDAPRWDDYRNRLAPRLGGDAGRWLSGLRLGAPGWSAHCGRMSGMILTRALFPDALRTLHLDADMVVPEEFRVNLETLPDFASFRITGCPDLSRLEWIELAALRSLPSTGDSSVRYVRILRNWLNDDDVDALLAHYTDLSGDCCDGPLPRPDLPRREEFHGATYVLSPRRFGTTPYGEWYDNDWTFFAMIRGPARVPPLLPQALLQLSRRKHVLAREGLEFEELGKLLHSAALDQGDEESRLRRASAHRQSEIARVSTVLDEAGPALIERYGREISGRLHNAVRTLQTLVSGADCLELSRALARFQDAKRHWPGILEAAAGAAPFPNSQQAERDR